MSQSTIYPGKDLNITLNSPLTEPIQASGASAVEQVRVRMATPRTVQDVMADGAVQTSKLEVDPNENEVRIQVTQASALHRELRDWCKVHKAEADDGNSSNLAKLTLMIQNTVTGTGHYCTGVSAGPYQQQGQHVTWILPAAHIETL